MPEDKVDLQAPDEKDVILYCGNGHKKTLSEGYWLDWKARHGPGTVMMCGKCNDQEILHLVEQIHQPFLNEILARAAKIEAQEDAENKYFKELYKP